MRIIWKVARPPFQSSDHILRACTEVPQSVWPQFEKQGTGEVV